MVPLLGFPDRILNIRSAKLQWRLLGVRITGTFGDKYPQNKVPVQRARSKVRKGPLSDYLGTTSKPSNFVS